METIAKQFKQLLITALLSLCIVQASAQVKHHGGKAGRPAPVSRQLKEFKRLAAQANITFLFPAGFKEIKAPNNEYLSFDYALGLPGKDFEIWFQVKSDKENWASYEKAKNNQKTPLANPDSLYAAVAAAQAIAFTGDQKYFVRNIPSQVLARYNADAGKSYFLTLLDLPETKHYKYALLITLHKNHTGTVLAVCFANVKGPEFFKNIDKAGHCLKFNP